MTKTVKLLIAAVAVILAAAVIWAVIASNDSDSTQVVIVQNNKVIYELDLSTEADRTFRIESPDGGWNEVCIKDGKISITDADCHDHTCVKTGILRSESIPIVCLPHKLVIRYADKEQ